MRPNQGMAAVAGQAAPLELALEQSQEVKAKVEECADDIGNANVLVKETIASGGKTLSAHKALEAGIEVESKVQECADDLHEVTETLVKGIEDLRQTEAELAASKNALARTQAALEIARAGEKEARLQALHDSTTGLPNRELFDTRLEQAISLVKRHGGTLAVLFFDLDSFKLINDTHGHAAGDAVLQEIANRLAGHARGEDTVCRNGGDEFLYMLFNPKERSNIEMIAKGVAERVAQPVAWADRGLVVHTSIGAAIYPDDGASGEELIRSADAAMYLAKKRASVFAFAEPTNPPKPV